MPKSLRSSGIIKQLPFVKADALVGVPFVIETASHPRRDEGSREHGVKAHDVVDFQLRFSDGAQATMTLTAYSSRTRLADAARREELGPLTVEEQPSANGHFYAIVDYDKKKHGLHERPKLYGEQGEGMSADKAPGNVGDALTASDVKTLAEDEDDDLPF